MHSMPTLKQLEALPVRHTETVPTSYLDEMGHMNVQHYLGMASKAAGKILSACGVDRDYLEKKRSGTFALRQFLNYLAEVHAGDTVHVRIQMIGRDKKKFHMMHYLVNETTETLAATVEVLGAHADLELRRTTPMPDNIAARLDELIAQSRALGWDPPLCGLMRVRDEQ